MFDTDGNQEIDFEEFKVLEDIFSQSATNAMRKVEFFDAVIRLHIISDSLSTKSVW